MRIEDISLNPEDRTDNFLIIPSKKKQKQNSNKKICDVFFLPGGAREYPIWTLLTYAGSYFSENPPTGRIVVYPEQIQIVTFSSKHLPLFKDDCEKYRKAAKAAIEAKRNEDPHVALERDLKELALLEEKYGTY